MAAIFQNDLTAKIIDFLTEIGLEVVPTALQSQPFLPGVLIKRGKILVDEEKLLYPGDLLHEAGHLAVISPRLRNALSDDVSLPELNMEQVEILAIAWSYAAIIYLGLAPQVVFHEGGYKGRSSGLLLGFSLGLYPGAHGLQEIGMTATSQQANQLGVAAYPYMLKWLRD